MTKDEYWMQIAIKEAKLAARENEIPVGAVIVQNDILVASAHNQPIKLNDPTAHAEIQAIRIAAKKKENYRLIGTTLYVTLEPCAMCFGAIMHARIHRIVFGALDHKTGVCGSCEDFNSLDFFNHKVSITSGVLQSSCSEILNSFFKKLR
tara:strand:+ start:750 stop:1199 length:450 start_codon:yes stop_codon:yes gene_type:complete